MAYLTTKSLPADIESVMAWIKPSDMTLHITLDVMSDTMMVQLGWRSLVRGVRFGVSSMTKEDVAFMLDRCAADLRDDIERYIASSDRPKPAWIQRVVDSMEKFNYPEKTQDSIAKTLMSTGVEDMPHPVVKHRYSGTPQLCWTDRSVELLLDFTPSGGVSYRQRHFGGKSVGGNTADADQVAKLLQWFKDGGPDDQPYY